MAAVRIWRFGGVLRGIGYMLVIPALVGGTYLLRDLWAAGQMRLTMYGAQETADRIAAALAVFGFDWFPILRLAAFSFTLGILGFLFLQRRSVYRCDRCGFILDRG